MDFRTRRLLRMPEVLALVRFSSSTLYRKMGTGEFPRPIDIGENAVAWWEDEVLEWIRERPRSTGYAGRKTRKNRRS